MSTPYVGEIRLLPYFRGAPSGWQVCDGSLLQISQYDTLFTLLSTTYGGDGTSTFAVPDLRSRVPVHQGSGGGLSPRPLGSTGGSESVTLNTAQMAPHVHYMLASTTPAGAATPAGNVLAAIPTAVGDTFYATSPQPGDAVSFGPTMLQPAGSGQPHDNTAPTLTLQYCIAWAGIWPAQQ